MLSIEQLAQKLEDWDDNDWHYWPFVAKYLDVNRAKMKDAIRFQRLNHERFNHVMIADQQGFYKRVDRGDDLRRYIARRDKYINTHNKMLSAVEVRHLSNSDPNTIEGQLAIFIQEARNKSMKAYEDALRLPAILAQHSVEEQWVIIRAINSSKQ